MSDNKNYEDIRAIELAEEEIEREIEAWLNSVGE